MKSNNCIEAKIIADSVNPYGDRLTTFVVRAPRFVLAEFNTHRMLSRNAASSRAIPVDKMIASIRDGGARPLYWGANQSGMQAQAQLAGEALEKVQHLWDHAKQSAIVAAEELMSQGCHKQIANRIIEPWQVWTGLTSATDWGNFFALRAHKDAQPEFQVLAYRMLDAYLRNEPDHLNWGEWHLPYGDQIDTELPLTTQIKVCVARAARLSYATFEGEIDVEKDIALYDKLMGAHPLHASPAEHPAQAKPNLWLNSDICGWADCVVTPRRDAGYAWSWPLPYDSDMVHQGNFRGWTQWRKMQVGEHRKPGPLQLEQILDERPDWFEL